jgi:hypothetical protein
VERKDAQVHVVPLLNSTYTICNEELLDRHIVVATHVLEALESETKMRKGIRMSKIFRKIPIFNSDSELLVFVLVQSSGIQGIEKVKWSKLLLLVVDTVVENRLIPMVMDGETLDAVTVLHGEVKHSASELAGFSRHAGVWDEVDTFTRNVSWRSNAREFMKTKIERLVSWIGHGGRCWTMEYDVRDELRVVGSWMNSGEPLQAFVVFVAEFLQKLLSDGKGRVEG